MSASRNCAHSGVMYEGAAGMTPWPRLPFSEGALKMISPTKDAGKTAPSEHF